MAVPTEESYPDASSVPVARRSPVAMVGAATFGAALLLAGVARFYHLSLKPLHSDEGVNGWFLMNLFRGLAKASVNYQYDPTNYHGPFFYFAGLIPFLAGPSEASLRFLPALAGAGCVAVLWPIRRWLGWAGLATAAFLLAVSPPFVYFSRTAIHEIYVFFFSLLAVVCFIRAYAGAADEPGEEAARKVGRNWFLAGVVSLALVFTNKETAVITFASFVGAVAIAWFFSVPKPLAGRPSALDRVLALAGAVVIGAGPALITMHFIQGDRPWERLGALERSAIHGAALLGIASAAAWLFSSWGPGGRFDLSARVRRLFLILRPAIGGLAVVVVGPLLVVQWAMRALAGKEAAPGEVPLHALIGRFTGPVFKPFKSSFDELSDYGLAYCWGIAVVVVLFTSFFNNMSGAVDMFATYLTWVERGHEGAGHTKPFVYWIELLWEFDAPILVLALLGTVAALYRRDRFGLFVAAWSWSLWLVYSVISYKTPWLNLNFTGPMCLLGGIAVRELARLGKREGASGEEGPARVNFLEMALTVTVPLAILFWPVPAGPVLAAGAKAEGGQKVENVSWAKLSWDVNFAHHDDDRYKIIYVQTVRDYDALIGRLDRLFETHGKELTVWVTSGDYWPMPFSLRHYDTVGYHQGKIPGGTPPSVVIASSGQEAELRGRLAGYRVERFMLRPGVVLTLYAEPAVWDPVFGPPSEHLPPEPAPEDETLMAAGLVAEYRYGIGCTGEVLAKRVEAEPSYGGRSREFRAPVCVTWKGHVRIDEAGDYAFTSRSDDGSWVFLDGELALDNGGTHGPMPRTGVLRRMEEGLHPIEVRYFDAGGGAVMELTMTRRGGVPVDLRSRLVHDVRTADEVRRGAEAAL